MGRRRIAHRSQFWLLSDWLALAILLLCIAAVSQQDSSRASSLAAFSEQNIITPPNSTAPNDSVSSDSPDLGDELARAAESQILVVEPLWIGLLRAFSFIAQPNLIAPSDPPPRSDLFSRA